MTNKDINQDVRIIDFQQRYTPALENITNAIKDILKRGDSDHLLLMKHELLNLLLNLDKYISAIPNIENYYKQINKDN